MYLNIFKQMKKNGGFTLIEVIVTLIVASILGTMLVTFMGSAMTGSVQPLLRVQNANTAGHVMENITTDYTKLNFDYIDDPTIDPLSTLKENIGKGSTDATRYGATYTIVHYDYVLFDDGDLIDDGTGDNWTLRVSIKQGSQTLTTLFTE